ncbi:hypothetical protein BJY16_006852 [Actinoplanes octamycinicus]|uniref:Uncharacterized protein n=1 Tax=Actinoplanes octamycinicus TaxID=135948 RepID=A0A7W7H3R4_9ACTN|nr:hypothetical protein [Actinoplanes octamycinicus]MBB4743393.1 hypothetical protein [Actinoplanes octamycinicus]GIE61909.1 hypothetical protein Aoc01nite_73110 [Actinoplanes octamycinicus]
MTRNIEDLIRATQEAQADRALPADRIRANLPKRAATVRRRQRFGLLSAGVAAAAVAAAVTVPALALRGSEPVAPPTQAAAPASAKPSPSATTQELPTKLGYRPTWAPPGFSERIRQTGTAAPGDPFGPTVMRYWTKQVGTGDPMSDAGPQVQLYVRTEVSGEGRLTANGGKKVDINGAPGYYHEGGGKSYLDWGVDEHTVLSLATTHYVMSKADMLKMARSVRPDPGVTTVPVRLRWLPDGWSVNTAIVSGDHKDTWRAGLLVEKPAVEGIKDKEALSQATGQMSVVVGSSTEAPAGGRELTVGGHPARQPVRSESFAKSMLYLVVDLGHGRLMTLVGEGAGITREDLVKIAEQAEISPDAPDWIG